MGGKPVHSLLQMQADGSGITTLLASGTSPRTSPDGTKVLFRSTSTWRTLSVAPSHDLSQRKTVTTGGVQSIFGYDFSPDLTQVVFTVARADANCEDIYTVNMDGTSRTRLLDCVAANKYPSGVRWVQIP